MADKAKILIVDDNVDSVELLTKSLRAEGYHTSEAYNGEQALRQVEEYRPDLILLDIMMPKIDGYEVCRRLKNSEDTRHIPTIMLTAKGEIPDKVKGLDIGADDYMTKPFDYRELLARIKMILRHLEERIDVSPLTRLPGNTAIQKKITEWLQGKIKFAMCYLDIDHFKPFNKKYGFIKGDMVIKKTASIIKDVLERYGNKNDFIGHIGGDDFVFVTTPEKAEKICQKIIDSFDDFMPSLYEKKDREKGHIECRDRQGNIGQFPLITLSIGIAINRIREFTSYAQVEEIAGEMKSFAKSFPGSCFKIDSRRG